MPRPRRTISATLVVIVGLPVATLLAGAGTLALIGRGGLDRVSDPVRRTAQMQQVDIGSDRRAAESRLRGQMLRVEDGIRVSLSIQDKTPLPKTLRLYLEHPLDATRDLEILLDRATGDWKGPGFDATVGWRVSLGPADGQWRLVGRWPRGGNTLVLEPALANAPDDPDGPG